MTTENNLESATKSIINVVLQKPHKFLYLELSAKYNNLPLEERDKKVFEEMKRIVDIKNKVC